MRAWLALFAFLTACAPEPVSGPPGPPDGANVTDSTRARVQAFWTSFREATRLRLAGDFESAYSAYEQATQLNPGHWDAWYYLGNVSLELGRWSEAESAWLHMRTLNEHSARALSQLGLLYLCRPEIPMFDPAAAWELFEEAHAMNQEETGPVLRLGQAALVLGDREGALRRFDEVLGANDASLDAHILRAYLVHSSGAADAARRSLDDGLSRIRRAPDLPGEGDTRDGPMGSAAGGCPLFSVFGPSLGAAATPLDGEWLRRLFSEIDDSLRSARSRIR